MLLFYLFICSSFICSGQLSRTTTDVLAQNVLDKNQLPYSSNLDFLKNKAGRIPILESFDFRTSTDEYEIDQQEFTLRFDLNSNDERKAYDRVLASNKQLYSLMQDEYVSDQLENDYRLLVDYYFDLSELGLIKQDLSMVKDKRTVLSKMMSNTDNVNISNWLSNQDDIISLVMDSLEIEQSLNNRRSLLFGGEGKTMVIVFNDFISIDKISEVIKMKLGKGPSAIDTDIAISKEEKAKAEYELEEAETNKWLRFLQLRYQSDDDVSFQKEMSFSASINIPTKSTNKIKRNDAALEVLDKKYDRLLKLEESNIDYSSNILKLESALVNYSDLQKLIEEQELEETYDNYLALGNVSPLTLLGIQKNISKHKSKLLNAKKRIYEVYLDLICNSSVILEKPRVNFLTNRLEIIE